jgi:hypothetical protein
MQKDEQKNLELKKNNKLEIIPPNEWVEKVQSDGKKYYYNTITKKTQWKRPEFNENNEENKFKNEQISDSDESSIEEEENNTTTLPNEWVEKVQSDGKKYYYNTITKKMQWNVPNSVGIEDLEPESITTKIVPLPRVGSWINKCLLSFLVIIFCFCFLLIGLINKELKCGPSGYVLVAKDADFNEDIILKLIRLNSKNNPSSALHQQKIEKEMKMRVVAGRECKHLVHYSEVFEWEDYVCVKMEYCNGGNLQDQLNFKKIFTQQV